MDHALGHVEHITKVIKLIIDEGEIGQQRMWARVLLQAIQDVQGKAVSAASQHHQHKTRIWLKTFSEDMETICDLAGLSPSFFHHKMTLWLRDVENTITANITTDQQTVVQVSINMLHVNSMHFISETSHVG